MLCESSVTLRPFWYFVGFFFLSFFPPPSPLGLCLHRHPEQTRLPIQTAFRQAAPWETSLIECLIGAASGWWGEWERLGGGGVSGEGAVCINKCIYTSPANICALWGISSDSSPLFTHNYLSSIWRPRVPPPSPWDFFMPLQQNITAHDVAGAWCEGSNRATTCTSVHCCMSPLASDLSSTC